MKHLVKKIIAVFLVISMVNSLTLPTYAAEIIIEEIFDDEVVSMENEDTPVQQEQKQISEAETFSDGGIIELTETEVENTFTVYYHMDNDSVASDQRTEVTYGESTATITIEQLGFKKEGSSFAGWRVYRSDTQCWRVQDSEGNQYWETSLPDGYDYVLYGDGTSVAKTTTAGSEVHFYAQWVDNYYTIYYHETEEVSASEQTTQVIYGVGTRTLTAEELGFIQEGKVLSGWYVYREDTSCWRVKDSNGTESWQPSLKEGYEYVLYTEGTMVSKTVPAGSSVHFYGQWIDDYFTVYYHENDKASASEQTTQVIYGLETQTSTAEELGFTQEGKVFRGWYVYREDTGCWRVKDSDGTESWQPSLEEGYEYVLYTDGAIIAKTAQAGSAVHFYGQWMSSILNVTDEYFGATRDDQTDDHGAIQKALNFRKNATEENPITVVVPEGKYYISNSLYIYSNTILQLATNATIIRTDDSKPMLMNGWDVEEASNGYTQLEHVTISGGNWDGNITSLDDNGYGLNAQNLFYFWHGNDVHIKNTLLKECCGTHFIELAAMKDSTVSNVVFQDFYRYSGTNYSWIDAAGSTSDTEESNESSSSASETANAASEAIQLDFASLETSSAALPYDGSACQNIIISGCVFSNCMSGIGTHHTEVQTTGVTVSGNYFENMDGYCLMLVNMKNVAVTDNIAENIHAFGYITDGMEIQLTGNEMVYDTLRDTKSMHMIFVSNSSAVLTNNKISGSELSAVYANASRLQAENNTISKAQSTGFRFIEGSTGTLKDNTISEPGTSGVSVSKSAVNLSGTNRIEKPGSTGIFYENLSSGTIEGCTITETAGVGILVMSGCSDIVIKDNCIRNSGNFGILLENIDSPEVSGNEIQEARSNGIGVVEVKDASIVDNVILDAGDNGIYISASSSVVSGNEVTDSVKNGVRIVGNSDIEVKLNKINNVGHSGISVNLSVMNAENNSIQGSGDCGIYVVGGTISISDNTVSESGSYSIYVVDDLSSGNISKGTISDNILYVQKIEAVDTVIQSNNTIYGEVTDFTVYYHENNEAEADSQTSKVTYGTSTKTLTLQELGYVTQGRTFLGWKVYRDYDRTWNVEDADGKQCWSKSVPEGGSYYLYGDGWNIAKTAPAGTAVHFYAQWEDATEFTVYYHKDDNASASNQTSKVTYGTSTKIKTVKELGYSTVGRRFLGWKAYRDYDRTWNVEDADGKQSWSKSVPEGGSYYLYGDGWSIAKTAPAGTAVHFYAQWEDATEFTVYYHKDDNASASNQTSKVTYGTSTKTKTVKELGYSTVGRRFLGWKAYRDYDRTWNVEDADGKQSWSKSVPEGGSYYLYGDGWSIAKTAPAGTAVHFYAQWEDATEFTVYYHKDDNASASNQTSKVTYGTSTKTKTVKELGYSTVGRRFLGWKAYRDYDGTWNVEDADGKQSWSKSVPEGGSYYLYGDGWSIAKTAPAGTAVHFYAQWEDATKFTVYYHKDDNASASSQTSKVTYGTSTKTKTLKELGYSTVGCRFLGWKAYRDYDGTWNVEDADGKQSWSKSVPEGGSYYLYGDGWSIAKTAPAGTAVHFYAQWKTITG